VSRTQAGQTHRQTEKETDREQQGHKRRRGAQEDKAHTAAGREGRRGRGRGVRERERGRERERERERESIGWREQQTGKKGGFLMRLLAFAGVTAVKNYRHQR